MELLKHCDFRIMPAAAALLLVCLAGVTPAAGQYSITWSSIHSGGGGGAGGVYYLDGTIGQPAAEARNICKFALGSGYWPQPRRYIDLEELASVAHFWLWTAEKLPGDFDGNNTVNMVDYSMMAAYWMCYCPYNWRF